MSAEVAGDALYLGKVIHADWTWAKVEPLASLVDGGWQVIRDRERVFPSEGRVFSVAPAQFGTPKDGMWVFSRRLNERSDRGKDHFLVESPSPAIAVFNLSDLTLEEARQKLFETGLKGPRPLAQFSVVLLSGDMFCVVELAPNDKGTLTAQPASAPWPLFSKPNSWRELSTVEAGQYLPSRQIPECPVAKRVNWCSDRDFVEKVLDRFRKHALQLGDTKYHGPTKDGIRYVARALEQVELLPGDLNDADSSLERLREQWPKLQARFEATEGLRQLILSSDPAQKFIAEAVVTEKAELRPVLLEELRAELSTSIDELVERKKSAEQDFATLKMQCQTASERLEMLASEAVIAEKAASVAKSALVDAIGGIRESLELVSPSELPFARGVVEKLETALGTNLVSPPLLVSSTPPWSISSAARGETLQIEALGDRIAQESKRAGISTADLETFDTFLRSGELVLVRGDLANQAIDGYARCVSAGAVSSTAVDPSTIGLDDLWRVPGTSHPTAFALAWHRALATPNRVVVHCLRNVDAAPMQLWARSLFDVLQSQVRPRNLLVVATAIELEGAGEAKYEFENDLSQWLVPLEVGGAGPWPIKVAASLSSQDHLLTSLLHPQEGDSASDGMFMLEPLTELAASRNVSHRTFRAASASGNPESCHMLTAWAAYLMTGRDEQLPAILSNGYRSLSRLNSQR